MTALTNKFQETTQRLQQLSVWRPNDRDPFLELDRWRSNAHQTIEQIYFRKREQIEQLIDKHEREFMRQIARQRILLSSIRKRLLIYKEHQSTIRQQNEASIITDLNKIENDINTRLGRAEIHVECKALNLDDTVSISLRTYLSSIPSMYMEEISTRNQPPKKPRHRSANEIARAYDNWLEAKNNNATLTIRQQLQSARENEREDDEIRLRKQKERETKYRDWLERKKREGAFTKKRTSLNDDELKTELNATIE